MPTQEIKFDGDTIAVVLEDGQCRVTVTRADMGSVAVNYTPDGLTVDVFRDGQEHCIAEQWWDRADLSADE